MQQILMTHDRCEAKPENLDVLGSCRWSHKTRLLIECFDPGILWKEFGICADIKVSNMHTQVASISDCISAIHAVFPMGRYPRALVTRLASPSH